MSGCCHGVVDYRYATFARVLIPSVGVLLVSQLRELLAFQLRQWLNQFGDHFPLRPMFRPVEQLIPMGSNFRRMGCVQPVAVSLPLFRGDWHGKEAQFLSEEEM